MDSAPPAIPVPPQPKTSGLAIASLVCGIGGFPTAGLTGIAAIITGHLALSAIKRSGGALGGQGMSIAGLITGYLTVLILPIAILAGLAAPVILKQRKAADRTECISNTKMLSLAFYEFDSEYGSFPADETAKEDPAFTGMTGPRVLEQLEAGGHIPDVDRFLGVKSTDTPPLWKYFPGRQMDGDPSLPVLVSPVVGDKVVILRVDGSVTARDPAEVASLDFSTAVEIPAPPRRRK